MKKYAITAETLKKEIDRIEPGARLPAIRVLARNLRISPVTVLKAIKSLEQAGIVYQDACWNGRYYKSDTSANHKNRVVLQKSLSRSETIANELIDDLLSGNFFSLDKLPAMKELRIRFGCHATTLSRALGLLQKRGYIRQHGKCFVPLRQHLSRPAGSQVYFAAHPDIFGNYQSHVFAMVTAIERDIENFGWGQLQFHFSATPAESLSIRTHQFAGFIFMPSFSRENSDNKWVSFFEQNSSTPLVVIDPSAKFRLHSLRAINSYKYICSDHHAAGQSLGFHLATLKHRHIAFLSFLPLTDSQPWLKQRYEGLKEIYDDFPDGAGRSLTFLDTSLQTRDPKEPANPAARKWSDLLWASYNIARAEKLLPDEILEERYRDVLKSPLYYEHVSNVGQHFERLLENRSITAWVCINDHMATMAHSFLRKQGIGVPEQISLAGFDNSLPAIGNSITSYDFTLDKMGHLAMSFLLHGPSRFQTGSRSHLVKGQLIVRRSTGPCADGR